jgi:DNA polymerase-3 subunit alpha/error-prone DNA polymerase
MGLGIDPPDVTVSRIRWTGWGRRLRVGLMAVGGLSRCTMEKILRCRRASGFVDMTDFLNRVQPDEDEAVALVHCGALDALDRFRSRTRLAWTRVRWQAERRRSRGQMALFAARAPTGKKEPPTFPPTDATTRLRREFAVLGFLCDRHPITLFADAIRALDTVKADRLADRVGRRVRLAAWLVTGKVVRTKHGDPMEFLTFEDETGMVETTFFPQPYRRFCHMLGRNRPYLLAGKVETNWGAATLAVDRVAEVGGKFIATPS